MAHDDDEFREPLDGRAVTRRAGYGLLFILAFGLGQTLMNFAAIAQFVILAINRKPNLFLIDLGRSLAIWQAQTCAYLTAATDEVPFPFAPWPDPER